MRIKSDLQSTELLTTLSTASKICPIYIPSHYVKVLRNTFKLPNLKYILFFCWEEGVQKEGVKEEGVQEGGGRISSLFFLPSSEKAFSIKKELTCH